MDGAVLEDVTFSDIWFEAGGIEESPAVSSVKLEADSSGEKTVSSTDEPSKSTDAES